MIVGIIGYVGTAFVSFFVGDFYGMKTVTLFGLLVFILYTFGTLIEVRDLRHSIVQPIDPEEILSKYQQENNALLSVTMLLLFILIIFVAFWIASGGF